MLTVRLNPVRANIFRAASLSLLSFAVQKSFAEMEALAKKKAEQKKLKEARRAEQERRVKEKATKKGKLIPNPEMEGTVKDADDDIEWFKQEVGEAPDSGSYLGIDASRI
jgi:hypothetical protein